MNILVFVFNFLVIVIVVIRIVKASKSFMTSGRMFNNVEERIRQRYNSVMQNNILEDNKAVNEAYESVDLDSFMKSNSSPIKEAKGRRRKI